jgi:hypothetical protein
MIGVVGRFAATTLLATGLLVSTFLLEFLVEGAVFLLVRDFFSIVVFSGCFIELLYASTYSKRRAKPGEPAKFLRNAGKPRKEELEASSPGSGGRLVGLIFNPYGLNN